MIKDNIILIRREIIDACKKVGRDPKSIKILAASKYHSVSEINQVFENGIELIGESKVQEMSERLAFIPSKLRIDFIGNIQTNKIKDIVKSCHLIHSVGSLKTAEKTNTQAKKINKNQEILLEINVSGEPTKSGFDRGEILNIFPVVHGLSNINILGLMTMAPHYDDPEQTRPIFSTLRQIRDELENIYKVTLPELSMGMSSDYKIAIEEGATIIRLGRIIFG